jgi:aminoglycoside phosphotransferase (APT) family kinase protein
VPLDPVHAVLSPPELPAFRALVGLDDEPLEVEVEGWSKLVLLSSDRAFLFARRGRERALLHGAEICQALAGLGVTCVPVVLGRWGPDELPSGPCVAFERRRGRPWASLEEDAPLEDWLRMLESLGRTIASWHAVGLERFPPGLVTTPQFEPRGFLSAALGDAPIEEVLAEAAELAGPDPGWPGTWRSVLERVRALEPVLLHGDVCENQLLVDDELRVSSVLDWDTACAGHRLHDFDFGEWGIGIFRFEESFAELRRALWEPYRAALGGGAQLPSSAAIHLVFVLSDLVETERRRRSGTLDAWDDRRLAHLRAEIGPATAAAER